MPFVVFPVGLTCASMRSFWLILCRCLLLFVACARVVCDLHPLLAACDTILVPRRHPLFRASDGAGPMLLEVAYDVRLHDFGELSRRGQDCCCYLHYLGYLLSALQMVSRVSLTDFSASSTSSVELDPGILNGGFNHATVSVVRTALVSITQTRYWRYWRSPPGPR